VAITALSYTVLRSLRRQGCLPANASMIEFGRSNWYGDVSAEQFAVDLRALAPDADDLLHELENGDLFDAAEVFFRGIGGCATVESIDPGVPGSTHKFDLNDPVPLEQTYDIVANYGTGEHVFNVHQFYKTAHELTAVGGLMIHTAPMCGWVDHGFFNIQPTFFFDLAAANEYEPLLFVIGSIKPLRIANIKSREQVIALAASGELPSNALIEVAMRRTSPAEFKTPMQGYYAGALSQQSRNAWRSLR
jgi:SAM-dependent methyltransferase